MSAPRAAPPAASPQLLRVLVRQNVEALQGLRRSPPRDLEGPAGRQHVMTLQELQQQTLALNERLDQYAQNPPAPRPRRSWRDLVPPKG